jgi:hypothetical protein
MLLVDLLIEQVSEPMESELIMPNIKQCMQEETSFPKFVQSTLDNHIKL